VTAPGEELTFEQARDELEAIVRRLEDGRTTLDEALALWERGERLHELCRAKLDAAEARVAELLERMGAREPPPGR
jgi:exodeoxyribonuclease VII small subunit